MPPGSNASWPQWIERLREPAWPVSVIGVRPAASRTGTLSRDALIRPQTAFAVPTVTCTITAAGLPRHAVIAMRHRHRDILVRDGDKAGNFPAARRAAGQRLDNGREIGAGIGEDILDTTLAEPGQIGLRRHGGRCVVFLGHGFPIPAEKLGKVAAGGSLSTNHRRLRRPSGEAARSAEVAHTGFPCSDAPRPVVRSQISTTACRRPPMDAIPSGPCVFGMAVLRRVAPKRRPCMELRSDGRG